MAKCEHTRAQFLYPEVYAVFNTRDGPGAVFKGAATPNTLRMTNGKPTNHHALGSTYVYRNMLNYKEDFKINRACPGK